MLYLLAACQKYELTSVQSFIRDAIASGTGLIPEMENAARHTLDHPMTFEILGEGLRLFDGWALRDLANFRRRYRDNLVSCLGSFLKTEESQFKIWTTCVSYTPHPQSGNNTSGTYLPGSYSRSTLTMSNTNEFLPSWLVELFQQHLNESRKAFSRPLFNPRNIRGEYLSALKNHLNSYGCVSCSSVHSLNGEMFCKELEDKMTQALSEVCTASFFGGIAGV